ncbi:hypothetical protein F0310_02620 [Borrelia sp. A-FGy1]|uniref:hypothetical protein n=1 Tax=Borrelia sp. A-FGy1 TaxID=2608247 RepID=UPI0015F4E1AC|nr:hypothetical protein [Borrelia sp. A-FGy1]QMU99300.1 hypothetical protein F0310_02620 [Borrelia sp. A-FGy1]
MNKFFLFILIFFIQVFVFGIDLENIDFYRALDRRELVLVIHLFEREKYLSQNSKLLIYIDLAKEALAEKDIRIVQDKNRVGEKSYIESLRRPENYSSEKFVLNVSKALNILIYFDSKDRILKTLDGRNIGIEDGKFVILDSFYKKSYGDVSKEHTTIEIYEVSILNPDFNKFRLDKVGSFVFLSEFNKKVYFNNISSLSNIEILFLFYELFPISKLKGIKDWFDFGFLSILKEIKKVYSLEIDSRRRIEISEYH